MRKSEVDIATAVAAVTQNTTQQNTGTLINGVFADIKDSYIHYTKRTKYQFFHEYEVNVAISEPNPATVINKRYICNWTTSSFGIPVNSAVGSICYTDGVSWMNDATFVSRGGQSKDWMIYDTITGQTKTWDSEMTPDGFDNWILAGKIGMIVNHNDTLNKQGGIVNEFNHISNAQMVALNAVFNTKLAYLETVVKKVGAYTATPVTNDVVIDSDNFVVKYNGSAWIPYNTLWDISTTPDGPQFNYIAFNIDNSHSYFYNYKSKVWSDMGINIHTNHNSNYGLQGGIANEYNHLSNAQVTFLNSLFNVILINYNKKVKKVGSKNSTPAVGDAVIYNEKVMRYVGGATGPLLDGWEYDTPSWSASTSPDYTYIILNEDDNHNWIFNYKTEVWSDMGINIHVDHNSIHGLQGGTTNEKYHLTADQWSSLLTYVYTQTIYVNNLLPGVDTNDGLTAGTPFLTINKALSQSSGRFVELNLVGDFSLTSAEVTYLNRNKGRIKFTGPILDGSTTITLTDVSTVGDTYAYETNVIPTSMEKSYIDGDSPIINTGTLNIVGDASTGQRISCFDTGLSGSKTIKTIQTSLNITSDLHIDNDIFFERMHLTGSNIYLNNNKANFINCYVENLVDSTFSHIDAEKTTFKNITARGGSYLSFTKSITKNSLNLIDSDVVFNDFATFSNIIHSGNCNLTIGGDQFRTETTGTFILFTKTGKSKLSIINSCNYNAFVGTGDFYYLLNGENTTLNILNANKSTFTNFGYTSVDNNILLDLDLNTNLNITGYELSRERSILKSTITAATEDIDLFDGNYIGGANIKIYIQRTKSGDLESYIGIAELVIDRVSGTFSLNTSAIGMYKVHEYAIGALTYSFGTEIQFSINQSTKIVTANLSGFTDTNIVNIIIDRHLINDIE